MISIPIKQGNYELIAVYAEHESGNVVLMQLHDLKTRKDFISKDALANEPQNKFLGPILNGIYLPTSIIYNKKVFIDERDEEYELAQWCPVCKKMVYEDHYNPNLRMCFKCEGDKCRECDYKKKCEEKDGKD